MAELLNNKSVVLVIMGIVAFLVTQGLKWAFVKPYTKNLNTRAKTIINSVILLIAFGSAVLCEFLYSHFWLHSAMSLSRASYGWGYASGIYGILEMVIKFIKGEEVKIDNPYKSEIGQETSELIKNIVKDNKINKEDTQTIKDFASKLNSVK
jgi:formate hydrogenlyase subunit 3/multisubunit Na+/H+ antiporter MnhD subunit